MLPCKLTLQHHFVWSAVQHISIVNVQYSRGKKIIKKKPCACKGDEMDEMAKLEKETCCAQASWLNKVYHESVH